MEIGPRYGLEVVGPPIPESQLTQRPAPTAPFPRLGRPANASSDTRRD
jgi:hypothetical protein